MYSNLVVDKSKGSYYSEKFCVTFTALWKRFQSAVKATQKFCLYTHHFTNLLSQSRKKFRTCTNLQPIKNEPLKKSL